MMTSTEWRTSPCKTFHIRLLHLPNAEPRDLQDGGSYEMMEANLFTSTLMRRRGRRHGKGEGNCQDLAKHSSRLADRVRPD